MYQSNDGNLDQFISANDFLLPTIWYESERLCNLFNASWSHHLNDADVKALMDDSRLTDFTRTPLNDAQIAEKAACEAWNDAERKRDLKDGETRNWKIFNNGHVPTAQEVNDWSLGGMGHDSINQWVCVKARLKREKVRSSKCKTCKGSGEYWADPKDKVKCSHWREFDPPEGEGYQLWTTTSEGAPISPVFDSLETLCEWCVSGATTFADIRATKEEWMKMLDDDFVYHQQGNMIFL
jgi:hypothetical protein